MRIKLWTTLLCISAALCLPSCGGVKVRDTTIWSYVGDVDDTDTVAIGSHTNFVQRERMNIDQWVEFMAKPAICLSLDDYVKQKTAIDQACAKVKCSYEDKKNIAAIVTRVQNHAKGIKKIISQGKINGAYDFR